MNAKFIIYSIGKLLEILAIILLIPAAIAVFEIQSKTFPALIFDQALLGFVIAIPVAFICGNILKNVGNMKLRGNGIREGFAIVTFGWVVLSFFGAIPLMVYFIKQLDTITVGALMQTFTDAYFEIMSGFTTTGATILTNIEVLPRGILFWRSLTHWLGGMGIVTLALAILPVFGIASYQMFRGEVPGPTAEQLKPRLAQTSKILWGTYGLLTLAETMLLQLGGMSLFDALCHAFGTMATGGFSTRNASIAAYNSSYIEWVIIAFMFFAGMNFIIHYRIFFSQKFDIVKKNSEFHFYVVVILAAIIMGVCVLQANGIISGEEIMKSFRHEQLSEAELAVKITTEEARIQSLPNLIRQVAFQVTSITTTTGFCTADSDVWPNFIRYMLVVLMFFGGCAGSTGGGMKMIRIMVILKTAWREVKTIIQPRLIANIVGFVALFSTSFIVFSAIMCLYIGDFTTAITTVTATICNIGPGLSGVGATENYAWIPLPGKWVLTFCMLLGRLEIYTVFIALSPASWKR